ncbi:ankyrin repeat domain-containing protein [Pseudomonas japonica]|uniref:Ankyrin repeat-containing protein n=1 Tax=Pseudomonas japonica TaxID=256466 RepID=A0A239D363_9PSED|nr:ankyrin repeat domain-containing protein [Pseudomonas japonica]SNS26582.1 Ankyrin repeat-containing protein [Pseudomonas japonica]
MAEDEKKQAAPLQLPTREALRDLYGFKPEEFSKRLFPDDEQDSWLVDRESNAALMAASEKVREQEFITNVKAGKASNVERSIQLGINVNVQDKFGMTALHYAAATGFRPCVRLLVNSGKCDYLLQDNKGRLASELAYEWGRDYAVGLLLQKKEARLIHEREAGSL